VRELGRIVGASGLKPENMVGVALANANSLGNLVEKMSDSAALIQASGSAKATALANAEEALVEWFSKHQITEQKFRSAYAKLES